MFSEKGIAGDRSFCHPFREKEMYKNFGREFDLLSLLLHILSTGSATFQGPSCLEAHSGATDAKAVLSV
jgi:hypothetical protein